MTWNTVKQIKIYDFKHVEFEEVDSEMKMLKATVRVKS